jgi:hypothetical protein
MGKGLITNSMNFVTEKIISVIQNLYKRILQFHSYFYIAYIVTFGGPEHKSRQSKSRATVSRWLPTAAARVRARIWSSGICGGQSGAGAGFLRVLRFPCQSSFHQLLHNHPHLSFGAVQ